jgi:hypothetical protein
MGIATTYMRSFYAQKIDPYPVEIIKRVEKPTTFVNEEVVPRVDEREAALIAPCVVIWGKKNAA